MTAIELRDELNVMFARGTLKETAEIELRCPVFEGIRIFASDIDTTINTLYMDISDAPCSGWQ